MVARFNTIGRDCAMDVLRREKHYVRLPSIYFPEENNDAEETFSEENIAWLRKAINLLNGQIRIIVNLRVVDELQFEEIAERLGITTGGASSLYSKAVKKLRQMLLEK